MNKTYIYAAVSFVAGAALGGAATWLVMNENYKKRIEEEVETLRKAYKDYYTKDDEPEDTDEDDISEVVYRKNDEIISKNYDAEIAKASANQKTDYSSFFDSSDDDEEEEIPNLPDISDCDPDHDPNPEARPYVISEDEFYDDTDCERVEIYVFDDGMITDEDYEPIEDYEKIITKEALRAFRKNKKQDEIFTRVDSRHCIYAFEKQGETWNEVLKRHPIILETNY